MNNALKLALAASCLLSTQVVSATLMNGEFDDGFNGWQGALNYGPPSADVPEDNPENFAVVDGSAVLSTTGDTGFAVDLFQEVTIPNVPAHITLFLEATGLSAQLTDPTDFFDASFIPDDLALPVVDLSGGPADVTALAGKSGIVGFLLVDGGDNRTDTLTIDRVAFSRVPVPATLSLMLLALGFGALARRGHA
jgi:hypothetical protein